jgi:SAM-dependent methyltransferase
MAISETRPSYGIDAPGVVQGLGLSGMVLLAVSSLPGFMQLPAWLPSIATACFIPGVATGGMALWMILSSVWLKQLTASKLLDTHVWMGSENVLDVGCGSGLLSIASARRVPRGRVTALDIWQSKDLSGNSPEALLANAHAARVGGRLQVETGDARALPFENDQFDVVGSMTVIHNIPDHGGRDAAIDEMWRVLKPGGSLLLFDISHTRCYARRLRQIGAQDVRLSHPIFLWGMPGWRLFARKVNWPSSNGL